MNSDAAKGATVGDLVDRLQAIADEASGRHDPCGMCDGSGPWEAPWVVVDDIKGGHWDNEFHVLTEGGEDSHLATFEYRPHAEHFAAFDPPTVRAMLAVVEAIKETVSPAWDGHEGPYLDGVRADEMQDVIDALARLEAAVGSP